jgi:hypothetical protein
MTAGRLTVPEVHALVLEGAKRVQQAAGLSVDGKAGPNTRKAVQGLLEVQDTGALPSIPAGPLDTAGLTPGGSPLARQFLARIRWYAQQRAREIGGNNSGPWVAHFHRIPDDGDPDDDGSWCASTVATCLEAAARSLGAAVPADYSRRQRGGARALWNQIRKGGRRLVDPGSNPAQILPGDVVLWDRGTAAWQAHIEIVSRYDADHDELESYGGNVGGFRRVAGRVRLHERENWRNRLDGICRIGG